MSNAELENSWRQLALEAIVTLAESGDIMLLCLGVFRHSLFCLFSALAPKSVFLESILHMNIRSRQIINVQRN